MVNTTVTLGFNGLGVHENCNNKKCFVFQEAMNFHVSQLLGCLPNIKKWLSHVQRLPRMHQTSSKYGFNMTALGQCMGGEAAENGTLNVEFTIPLVTLTVEEDTPEIG